MRKPTGWSVYVVHSPDRKISTKISKVHKSFCHAYEKNLIIKQSRENKRAAHIALSVWGLRASPQQLRSIGVAATLRGRCHSKVTSPTDFTHRNTGLQTGTAILYTVVYYCHLVVKCRKFRPQDFSFRSQGKRLHGNCLIPWNFQRDLFDGLGKLILVDFFFFFFLHRFHRKVYVSLYLEGGTRLLPKK